MDMSARVFLFTLLLLLACSMSPKIVMKPEHVDKSSDVNNDRELNRYATLIVTNISLVSELFVSVMGREEENDARTE